MSTAARRQPSRQDVEGAIQKVIRDQEAYYAAWLQSWSDNLQLAYSQDRNVQHRDVNKAKSSLRA